MSEHARTAILLPLVRYTRPLHVHQWAIRKEQQLYTNLLDPPHTSDLAAILVTSAANSCSANDAKHGIDANTFALYAQHARQWCPIDRVDCTTFGALLPLEPLVEPLVCTKTLDIPLDAHPRNGLIHWTSTKVERTLALCAAVRAAFPRLDVPILQVCLLLYEMLVSCVYMVVDDTHRTATILTHT